MTGMTRFDIRAMWLPATLVFTLVAGTATSAWWLRGLTQKVDSIESSVGEIKTSMEILTALAERVGANTGRTESLQGRMIAQDRNVATMAAWIQTTRIALAEQGFKTPPLPDMKGDP